MMFQLSDSYKQLRRTFKQQDPTNSGSVPVKIFKDILNQYKCSLNDEEFYTLTSQMDTRMDGTINYNYFIQQYLKNAQLFFLFFLNKTFLLTNDYGDYYNIVFSNISISQR